MCSSDLNINVNSVKKEISSKQNSLNYLISQQKNVIITEEVLKTSQEIDELIIMYIKSKSAQTVRKDES